MPFFFSLFRPTGAKELTVDFEFQPPQWRTAICLPDDPYKTLVDDKGTLLYHYGRANNDFAPAVSVVVDHARKRSGRAWFRRACRSCEPSANPKICGSSRKSSR